MIVRQLNDLDEDRVAEAATWVSRRLVLAKDKVGFSFHDTVIKAGSETKQWHQHHFESVYCIEGEGELSVDDEHWPIGPGTVYVPDHQEPHVLKAKSDMRLMVVMSPPLTGTEVQDELGSFPVLAKPKALRRKNIYVIGLNDFNRNSLSSIRNAENYEYLPLLTPEDVLERDDYDVDGLIERARDTLASSPERVDGLIHYIDFPVSTMVPILCREARLPSASLEAVLKFEHKYWSRVEQAKCIPDHVPPFRAFDPFDDDALSKLGLAFPFWIKPIKSFSSYLGFKINGQEDWDRAIPEIRENIRRFSSFDQILDKVQLPDEVADIGGTHCIAEGIIGGRQCTQEGFSHKGRVSVYGTVDSVRVSGLSSFARYQYPSRLPANVRKRMTRITETFIKHVGYDNAPFNIEYFWDANEDKIWFLEANSRISESHTDLFWKVDGASHHEIAVDLSLGARPRLPYRDGEFACAAKCFVRRFGEDAMVERVPTEAEIDSIKDKFPGTVIKIIAEEGKRLSDLMDQDSYSYVLALMWIGGSTPRQLDKRYEKIVEMLNFEFTP
jgi:quercetin dioxygenase-like cupin family protein